LYIQVEASTPEECALLLLPSSVRIPAHRTVRKDYQSVRLPRYRTDPLG